MGRNILCKTKEANVFQSLSPIFGLRVLIEMDKKLIFFLKIKFHIFLLS